MTGARRQVMWRAVYELLGARVRRPEWAFMNYGYAPPPGDDLELELDPADEPDRLCIQLYASTVDGTDLAGKDVLEVGSGRGGGALFLSRYRRPRTMTGLDFSATAVDLCARHRHAPGLRFVRGDAQSMPFPDGSFDAVVNIESSHCYASMEAFLTEVHRVLRPGGAFLFADLRAAADVTPLRGRLASSGLTTVRERDITAEVLRAMQVDAARKQALMDAWIPRVVHGVFRPFAGLEGTRNYVGLETGDLQYLQAHLVKPQASAL